MKIGIIGNGFVGKATFQLKCDDIDASLILIFLHRYQQTTNLHSYVFVHSRKSFSHSNTPFSFFDCPTYKNTLVASKTPNSSLICFLINGIV